MARPKNESATEVKSLVETPEKVAAREALLTTAMDKIDTQLDKSKAVERFQRDENGLLKNVTYFFKEDGTIDWKMMIPDKYVVVNTEYFEKRQIAVPDSTAGLDDKQKLVLLGGIKELLKIRGLVSVEKKVWDCSNDRAVVSCKLTFTPNYETDMKTFVYEEVANATLANTNNFSQMFLETIASNRALVRAGRNALRIDIVGSDELSSFAGASASSETTSESEPWHALRDAAKNAATQKFPDGFKSFEDFKGVLVEKKTVGAEEWNDWKDIPPTTIFKLIGLLKKQAKA